MTGHPPWVRVQTKERHAPVRVDQLAEDALLVSYDRLGGARIRRRSGYPHRQLWRWHEGDLVHLTTTEGHQVHMTPMQRVIARWSARPGVAVYLMRSHDDHWRIGTAELHMEAQAYDFGPARRAADEGAVEQWLLDVVNTTKAAHIMERAMGREYGITEHCFHRYRARLATNGVQVGQEPNPLGLLRRFGRDVRAPFWRADVQRVFGCRAQMDLRACNLLPGWMEVPTDAGVGLPKWLGFTVQRVPYNGPVHRLVVPKYQHYVADGVVLHDAT